MTYMPAGPGADLFTHWYVCVWNESIAYYTKWNIYLFIDLVWLRWCWYVRDYTNLDIVGQPNVLPPPQQGFTSQVTQTSSTTTSKSSAQTHPTYPNKYWTFPFNPKVSRLRQVSESDYRNLFFPMLRLYIL